MHAAKYSIPQLPMTNMNAQECMQHGMYQITDISKETACLRRLQLVPHSITKLIGHAFGTFWHSYITGITFQTFACTRHEVVYFRQFMDFVNHMLTDFMVTRISLIMAHLKKSVI
jgi:hypothetical protein